MTSAEIGRGLQATFDAACYVVGFLTIVAICGGFLDLRLGKKYRQLQRDLKRARWKTLYR